MSWRLAQANKDIELVALYENPGRRTDKTVVFQLPIDVWMIADCLYFTARSVIKIPDTSPRDVRRCGPLNPVGRCTQIGKGSKLIDQIDLITLKRNAGILLLTDVIAGVVAGTGRTGKQADRILKGKVPAAVMTLP
jgi:hypothetical protein